MVSRQWRSLSKIFVVILGVYFGIKLIGSLLRPRNVPPPPPFQLKHKLLEAPPVNEHRAHTQLTLPNCKMTVQLAVIVQDSRDCRAFSQFMHTLLRHRKHGLRIHVVGNTFTYKIVDKLLDTWTLPYVTLNFIDIETLKAPTENRESFLIASLPYILPPDVHQAIYLSNKMRMLEGLDKLWDQFMYFTSSHRYGFLPNSAEMFGGAIDILLLQVSMIRREVFPHGYEHVEAKHKIAKSAKELLQLVLGKYPYLLACNWGVSISAKHSVCDLNHIKALIWDKREHHFTGDEVIEAAKQVVFAMLSSDGEFYRSQQLDCKPDQVENVTMDRASKCQEFRYASALKKRTHLYYLAEPETYRSDAQDANEVVLLTQFTLDRFQTFERFMSHWEGPVIVVLYVTDTEALSLVDKVESSDVLKRRTNIAYHLVYKRGKFYPINYLRNVAVNNTHSPYMLFVDVDLVVNRGIYTHLRKYISKYLIGTNNMTLVIPAFEALEPLDVLPKDRNDLLTLMSQDKVVGYRMNRGWNLGHKPTNYPLWVKTDQPYKAIWKDAYEPYMVIASHHAPVYLEVLLERMGDKIQYARELHARDYEFLVLHDAFILHLPHPLSSGTNMWKTYPGYAKCGSVLFEEFRADLKYRHPDVKF